MTKRILMVFMCWATLSGLSWAQSWEIDLSAGTESASGGIHYRQFVDTGFLKVGGTVLYHSDDDLTCRLGSFNFFAGSDTLAPGLTLEVGLRGIVGTGDEDRDSGDVGNVGFAVNGEYLFSPEFFPLPIEALGMVTYAPEALAFRDSKNYWELTLGTGVRIGRYASVRLSYSIYDLEMETGSKDWSISSNSLRLGLVLRF
jgi:hypothetical protein